MKVYKFPAMKSYLGPLAPFHIERYYRAGVMRGAEFKELLLNPLVVSGAALPPLCRGRTSGTPSVAQPAARWVAALRKELFLRSFGSSSCNLSHRGG